MKDYREYVIKELRDIDRQIDNCTKNLHRLRIKKKWIGIEI